MKNKNEIAKELSELVSWSVSILGDAIKTEYGLSTFNKIERLRKEMKLLRGKSADKVYSTLQDELENFKKISDKNLHQLCNSYSLMLELINRCETAYRAYRLENKSIVVPNKIPRKIIFVLTAHPTEARSPEILGLFENIQKLLICSLKNQDQKLEEEIYHLLLISLKVALARKSKPTVADEANNIYSYILKDEILETIIGFSRKNIDVSFRSWVGGDKDGHPGVDEKTLMTSLNMSRVRIIEFIEKKLRRSIELVSYISTEKNVKLLSQLEITLEQIRTLKIMKENDGVKVTEFKKMFLKISSVYKSVMKDCSPELDAIERLMWIFPAMVVALEIREDSAVVAEALKSEQDYPIVKMLKTLKKISNGFEKKWYVRGFVLSMVEETKDIQNGLKLTKRVFGKYEIPVVPLFENEKALTGGVDILTELFKTKSIAKTHESKWGGRYEVMVGYSDSSKENGVLPSRIMISTALRNIEKVVKEYGLTPIFFHGSGGSIERGGGALKEQTGWWPKSAIDTFKATIQGEMVARNFGSEFVLSKQVQTILNQLGKFQGKRKTHSPELRKLTQSVRQAYSSKIKDDDFMSVIELATPYSFLHHLKIGSRPAKRAGGAIKNNLRAIPWILCWTQTRILFPTWWGIGTSWGQMTMAEKSKLKLEFKQNPVLISYVKALGFTLSKIELGVWKLYLENSNIDTQLKENIYKEFSTELVEAKRFFKEISGEKDFLWFRPWLQQSIDLRSSMIHPLNLCQLESLRRNDHELLRNSVTGIACGMLTTG